MQNRYEKYGQFTLADFVLDDDFIDWVKSPDAEKNAFWQGFVAANPQRAATIQQAKQMVVSLHISVQTQPEETKDAVWKAVMAKAGPAKIISLRPRRTWVVAASILALLAVSYVLFFNRTRNTEVAKVEKSYKPVKNDVGPGGNKAILTLASGATIVLDSAENGTLTQQGNTNVIKLDDGKLAYQPSTAAATVTYNMITTPRGGQYQLILSDGSKVWLNAASSINFPTVFTGSERRVTITGEAYFEVAYDASKPFHVLVNAPFKEGGMDIQVLGTHFNVNAYGDEELVKTTLLEGSVKVSRGKQSVMIAPGQQAGVNEAAREISVKKDVDIDQVVAWKNGYFQFANSTIQDIMRQLSRWYNVEVVYKGKIPTGHYVGKPSRRLNLSEILKVIEYSEVHLELEGNKIIVSE